MATKRNIRAAALSLDKATTEFAECRGPGENEAKNKLEEEIADAKALIRLGKKDHVDVEKLSDKMVSARLVIKARENKSEGTNKTVGQSVGQQVFNKKDMSVMPVIGQVDGTRTGEPEVSFVGQLARDRVTYSFDLSVSRLGRVGRDR